MYLYTNDFIYIYGAKTQRSIPEDRDIRALCGPSNNGENCLKIKYIMYNETRYMPSFLYMFNQ